MSEITATPEQLRKAAEVAEKERAGYAEVRLIGYGLVAVRCPTLPDVRRARTRLIDREGEVVHEIQGP